MSKRKLKVLFISGSWPDIKCGVGDYLYNLTKNFKEIDWTVLTSNQAKGSTNVLNLVKKWEYSDWNTIKDLIQTLNPDIIHYEYPSVMYGRKLFPNILPRLIKNNFKNIPLFITCHEYHDASFLGRKRIELTLKKSDIIFVSNLEDESQLREKFNKKDIEIVRVGSNIPVVEPKQDDLSWFEEIVNPKDQKIISYFGYIDPSKGIDELIESIKAWSQNTKLVLAASYNDKDSYHVKLKNRIQDLKGRIVWTDFIDSKKVSLVLKKSKLVILPFDQPASMRRGSLIAAMVHGCAIITTGPSREVLEHKKNCWLLSDNSANSISNAVRVLLKDEVLIKMVSSNAKKDSSIFSWEGIARQHVRKYKEFIE